MPINLENPIGEYIKIYLSRSRFKEVRDRRVAGGGSVTSILIYLIDKKLVDGVITARRVKGFKGRIVLAQTREDVLDAAGDKWMVIPYSTGLKDTIINSALERIAVVGLPCQVQFLEQMRKMPLLETDISERIYILISLFCMGTFASEAFLNLIHVKHGLRPSEILDIRLMKDTFEILSEKGIYHVTLSEAAPYLQSGCLMCQDYTGVFSDISAGTSDSHPGCSILISRTELGEKIIQDAAKEGYIEVEEAPQSVIAELKTKAHEKMLRALEYISRFL